MPIESATLIYNPIAGRHPRQREREIQKAAQALDAAGTAVELAPTSGPGAAVELAREAARKGSELVLVCGGDGTINEAVNGLATTSVPLGILPGGTANIIAKELRLPHDPARAARELSRWSPRRIALGRASWNAPGAEASGNNSRICRYFLSVAGVGFDAHIVYKLSSAMKMSLGVAGYVFEAIRQSVRYPFPVFTCQVNGEERRATFAVIQRTRVYAGWLHTAPSANLFEPRFALCLFRSRSTARYLLYATALLARQHLRLRDVELVHAAKVTCTPAQPADTIRFEVDGELAGTLPVTFEIVPDALTLLVPPQTGN